MSISYMRERWLKKKAFVLQDEAVVIDKVKEVFNQVSIEYGMEPNLPC